MDKSQIFTSYHAVFFEFDVLLKLDLGKFIFKKRILVTSSPLQRRTVVKVLLLFMIESQNLVNKCYVDLVLGCQLPSQNFIKLPLKTFRFAKQLVESSLKAWSFTTLPTFLILWQITRFFLLLPCVLLNCFFFIFSKNWVHFHRIFLFRTFWIYLRQKLLLLLRLPHLGWFFLFDHLGQF